MNNDDMMVHNTAKIYGNSLLGYNAVVLENVMLGYPDASVLDEIARKKIKVENHASVMLKFNGDKAGVVDTNWLTPHKVRKMSVIGIDGVAYLDYNEQTVSIHDGEWIREAKIEKAEPLKRELEHFIDVVRTGDVPIVSGEGGKHALEVALAAIESYKSGQIIRMD